MYYITNQRNIHPFQPDVRLKNTTQRNMFSEKNEMFNRARRPTIISPVGHIRSYSFRPFLALIVAACVLSFVGGYINTICLVSSFQTSLSAATGTTSKLAIELGKGNLGVTLHFTLIILSFILGSFISAAVVGGSSFRIQRSYGLVLLLESFALAFGYLFVEIKWSFGSKYLSLQVGAYLVSLACGLQNGLCTTFSGAVIRTTHMTGILTDIGLVLGQAIFYPRTRKHLWKLKVLLPLYGAFCLGGVIGWFAYQLLHIEALLLPCAVLGLLGIAHLCYSKIVLMQETRQGNKKHWKRNNPSRTLLPTVETNGSTNSAFDKQISAGGKDLNEDHPNEIEKTTAIQEPFDLEVVFVHDPKADGIPP